jgi:hypothetical protein
MTDCISRCWTFTANYTFVRHFLHPQTILILGNCILLAVFSQITSSSLFIAFLHDCFSIDLMHKYLIQRREDMSLTLSKVVEVFNFATSRKACVSRPSQRLSVPYLVFYSTCGTKAWLVVMQGAQRWINPALLLLILKPLESRLANIAGLQE